tara:strand:+ start:375 stop:932 length:558 start_codon:yes stop_codon:yes gene_type:complete
MKNYFFLIMIIFLTSKGYASTKENIILNLKRTENINFNFEQNINGKTERGNCTIEYPKKIFCRYNLGNQKILVSNGKWLIIKTSASYYKYPLEKTPLNYLLNKEFLIRKILNLEHRIIENKFINFKFFENENEINIFFDAKNFNLIGWQTLDLYQNLSVTYLNSILINQKLSKNLFKLPPRAELN